MAISSIERRNNHPTGDSHVASLLGMTAGTQEVLLMDKHEIREKLKNSLDMVNVTFWLSIAGIVVLIEGIMVLFMP